MAADLSLTGRVALVTGGSRGIGAAVSKALARAGATVALTYHSKADIAAQTVEEITAVQGHAMAVPLSIADRASVRAAVAEVRAAFGPITVLVNNAGIARRQSFLEISDADWDAVLGINLRGAMSCCQEILPDMQAAHFGRIINISSIGGQWGGVYQVHYAAAKAGLISLTRSLARIYSKDGITSNALAPGLVDTDMIKPELEDSAAAERIISQVPVGRIATPDEIAAAVVYLAGRDAGYITGQTLNINGGMYFG